MRTLFTFLVTLLLSCPLFSQNNFEGKCIYQVSFKNKINTFSDEQFSAMMGNRQDYLIKGGNYKSATNGQFAEWQLYVNTENKLYVKMIGSDTIFWTSAATNTDSVLNVKINKNVATILGYKCDELILTCKSGIQKYYYNAGLRIDPNLFKSHQFGNWYNYIKYAKALPLKMIIDNTRFTMESKAVEVKPMKIANSVLSLPPNAKTAPSPY